MIAIRSLCVVQNNLASQLARDGHSRAGRRSERDGAQVLDQKRRYTIRKLIDNKVAATFDLHELIGTADKLRG